MRYTKVWIVFLVFLFAISSYSEDISDTRSKVDWQGGFIEITAEGAYPLAKSVNQADATKLALTTARHLAYEKLAETTAGVKITARYTYKDAMLASGETEQTVKTVLQGARVINEKAEVFEDGSVLATVRLRMQLKGNKSIAARTFSIPEVKKAIAKSAEETPQDTSPQDKEKFSGLIVDCRGLIDFTPALTVKILNEDKETVYSSASVKSEIILNGDMVRYVSSLEDARKMTAVVGANPLVVEGVQISKEEPNSVIITTQQAEKIVNKNFLKDARVIFII